MTTPSCQIHLKVYIIDQVLKLDLSYTYNVATYSVVLVKYDSYHFVHYQFLSQNLSNDLRNALLTPLTV